MANRKRANSEEWERFEKKMKEKRMQRPKSDGTKEVGSNILKSKELIVQPLESEPSGKAKKYERTGPQEFVPFEEYDEVTIDNIKNACNRHFSGKVPFGMSSDILASDRGPSCTKMSHLPNLKLIHIRFLKAAVASSSFKYKDSSQNSYFKPSVSVNALELRRKSTPSSALPSYLSIAKQKDYPKSLPVSQMLRLGKVINMTMKESESVQMSEFLLSSMKWGNPNTVSFYIEEEPLAVGAFRGAYKAKINPTEKGKTYIIKKYLPSTYKDLNVIGESPENHAKKSVQMHVLAKNFADQLRMLLLSKEFKGDLFSYNKASYGVVLKSGETVTIEDYIDGSFTKYINNDGTILENSDENALQMAECLTHFSYVKSENALLLVDIQGCGYKLYDPEIATSKGSFDEEDELLFCMGNLSTVAKKNFFLQHKCSNLCLLAELEPFYEDI